MKRGSSALARVTPSLSPSQRRGTNLIWKETCGWPPCSRCPFGIVQTVLLPALRSPFPPTQEGSQCYDSTCPLYCFNVLAWDDRACRPHDSRTILCPFFLFCYKIKIPSLYFIVFKYCPPPPPIFNVVTRMLNVLLLSYQDKNTRDIKKTSARRRCKRSCPSVSCD